MKTIFRITWVMVWALISYSCASDDDLIETQPQIEFPEIVGVWEWVGTTGGLFESSETPESTGVTRDIVISEDQFIFYIGEDIIAERGYTFTYEESLLTGLEEFIVTFEDDGFRDIVRREDDFINFIDDCNDCYTSIYRLKN